MIILSLRRELAKILCLASLTAQMVKPVAPKSAFFQFGPSVDAAHPYGALVAQNGELFGTTYAGGATGYGTFYSLTPPAPGSHKWTEKLLWSFSGGTDGAFPGGALTPGPAGVFYGVTQGGGTSRSGTVFSLTPPTGSQRSWTKQLLYAFAGGSDGISPQSSLALGADGSLYGTTFQGGSANLGTVFSLSPPAASGGAWTHTVIFNFNGNTDGGSPLGNIVTGSDGTLYGTASSGGSGNCPGGQFAGCGLAYMLTPPAASGGAWTQNILYNFTGGSDGTHPNGVVMDGAGSLYGTTYGTGVSPGARAVYSLLPPVSPGGPWTATVLYTFTGKSDGGQPAGSLALGEDGTIYGAVASGGSKNGGAVYSLTPPASPGGPWSEAVLYNFGSHPGSQVSSVMLDTGGTIYGTAGSGGRGHYGTAFSLTPPGSPGGSWSAIVLHSFTDGGAGSHPTGGVLAADGIFGMTERGGAAKHGTICEMGYYDTSIVLHSFGQGKDGINPVGRLLQIENRTTLYGATGSGGAKGFGTIFSVVPPASPGDSASEAVIYSFRGGIDGANPAAGLVYQDGVLYGTTRNGGTAGYGTVFSLTPSASAGGSWHKATLYNFGGGSDGAAPMAALIDQKGVLIGTTYSGGADDAGTVYTLTPPSSPGGAWTESLIHSFAGSDGANPAAKLTQWQGMLYGTTSHGGPANAGTVFALSPPPSPGAAWTETTLYAFKDGKDGANPEGGLVVGNSNSLGTHVLYGATRNGGKAGDGILFSLAPPVSGSNTWVKRTEFMFKPGRSGIHPVGELQWAAADYYGILWGSTSSGGTEGGGTFYQVTIKYR